MKNYFPVVSGSATNLVAINDKFVSPHAVVKAACCYIDN